MTDVKHDATWSVDQGVLVLCTGAHFTTADLVAAFMAGVKANPELTTVPVLFDNRGSAEAASPAEIRLRAERLAAYAEVTVPRLAVLVSDELHYGLGRVASIYAGLAGLSVAVFGDADEAMAWLRGAEAGGAPRPLEE